MTLTALGSTEYAGLETFPNPGVERVEMVSDEFTAVCPVTGQPDQYWLTVTYYPRMLCLESKSLKLFLGSYRNEGKFCESLAVEIRDKILDVLKCEVSVEITQKSRGGITITATAPLSLTPYSGDTPNLD